MKKKIIGIIACLIVLYFTSITYYEGIADKLKAENANFTKDNGISENQKEQEVKEQEVKQQEQNTDGTADSADNESMQLYAQSAALVDADSGRVLYEKNGYEEMPMASTTKIMTCIVALRMPN